MENETTPNEKIIDFKYKKDIKRSRAELRKAKREIQHFIKEVEPIEIEFCNTLFNENSPDTYKDAYNHYLYILNDLVSWLNKRKYKVIEVDSYFFQKNYKPIESLYIS